MLSLLLDTEELKSRSVVRIKRYSLYKARSNCLRAAAGNFRRQCQKQFVDKAGREKLPEKCRPTFVKKPSYPQLRIEELENRSRGDRTGSSIQSVYLNGRQSRCARFCEHICADRCRNQ